MSPWAVASSSRLCVNAARAWAWSCDDIRLYPSLELFCKWWQGYVLSVDDVAFKIVDYVLSVTAGDSDEGFPCVCVCACLFWRNSYPCYFCVSALVLSRLRLVRCFDLVLGTEGCCFGACVCLGYTERASEFGLPKKFMRHWESPGEKKKWMNGDHIRRTKPKMSNTSWFNTILVSNTYIITQ